MNLENEAKSDAKKEIAASPPIMKSSRSMVQVGQELGPEAKSCSDLCNEKGLGRGRVIGTAPFCGGDCKKDCSGFCSISKRSFSDHGSRCVRGDKVCCCDLSDASVTRMSKTNKDVLTIMNFNTYLMEVNVIVQVNVKPALEDRKKGIAKWFQSLREEEVPEVLVLNEVFSFAAERLLRELCAQDWRKNDNKLLSKWRTRFLPCSQSSHFGFATQVANPTSTINPKKSSGVVVLVKKGLVIADAQDEKFTDCDGDDCMAKKGFWLVQVDKGTQKYWVVGTHTNAYEGRGHAAMRLKQFQQIRKTVDKTVPNGARIVYTGDMNIFTGPYKTSAGDTVTEVETDSMLEALGAPGVPANGGTLVPKGFWMPLDKPLDVSADIVNNFYLRNLPDEERLGSQQFDWVVVPSENDRLQSPASMRYQFVPMKGDNCFKGFKKVGETDDLSDHYAIFAQLCYSTDSSACPDVQPVQNHRGTTEELPSPGACPTVAP